VDESKGEDAREDGRLWGSEIGFDEDELGFWMVNGERMSLSDGGDTEEVWVRDGSESVEKVFWERDDRDRTRFGFSSVSIVGGTFGVAVVCFWIVGIDIFDTFGLGAEKILRDNTTSSSFARPRLFDAVLGSISGALLPWAMEFEWFERGSLAPSTCWLSSLRDIPSFDTAECERSGECESESEDEDEPEDEELSDDEDESDDNNDVGVMRVVELATEVERKDEAEIWKDSDGLRLPLSEASGSGSDDEEEEELRLRLRLRLRVEGSEESVEEGREDEEFGFVLIFIVDEVELLNRELVFEDSHRTTLIEVEVGSGFGFGFLVELALGIKVEFETVVVVVDEEEAFTPPKDEAGVEELESEDEEDTGIDGCCRGEWEEGGDCSVTPDWGSGWSWVWDWDWDCSLIVFSFVFMLFDSFDFVFALVSDSDDSDTSSSSKFGVDAEVDVFCEFKLADCGSDEE
jgi:hypothetical protein